MPCDRQDHAGDITTPARFATMLNYLARVADNPSSDRAQFIFWFGPI